MEVGLKIAFFFLFVNSVLTQRVLLSSDSERWALLDFRSSLGIRAQDWPKKAEPCLKWAGIKCQDGRVTGINLAGLRRTHMGRLNPRFAVDSLSNLTLLTSFNSSGFLLPGSIPEWLGQRLVALQVLDLRSCSIFGSIPVSLGTLSGLKLLYLSGNSLTGIIPAALGELFSLSVLDLSRNLLTGSIPSVLSALGNLTTIDLSSNYLTGAIPVEFGSLSSLKYLRLQNNSLSASIPATLGNLSQLVELDLRYNFLSGSLPENVGGLKSLQKILIGNNELGGALPARLFLNLTVVEYVVLRKNQFDGEFPDVLWSMSQLRFLDISENNLTGPFPKISASFKSASVFFNFSNNLFYGNVTFAIDGIGSIDLSSNYFGGFAPSSNKSNIIVTTNCFRSVPGQRSSEDCRSFYANRGLVFSDDDDAPDFPEHPFSEPSKNKNKFIYIVVGTFGGIGLIVILGSALVLMLKICKKRTADRRGVADVRPVSLEDSIPRPKASPKISGIGEVFTFDQILRVTGNFSDKNLVKHGHSGDLFRGILQDGNLVIIKRVDLHFLKKEAYDLELDLFSKVMHPRLVPLLGHCLEHENQKILVYKYMSNGDLSNSLYRDKSLEGDDLQSLDWITRLKIAIGTAEGLSYLHHECNPPLVHRDIQASSILLDDKYEVRLGSLSEVCVQGADNQHTMARLMRIPGTLEEGLSGSSPTTCADDVYCFGKVLLELVTGKLGVSSSDEASTNEWLENNLPYISISDKELVAKIVDQSLIIDEDMLEEVWAVAIVAKSCLNPRPSRRPLMKHIVCALENPFKVVREENFSSAKLRTTSSRRSWSSAFFGSWRHSSSGSANGLGQTIEATSGLKYVGRAGSHGSGANEYSSSHKRSSSEIFPEPVDMRDIKRRQDEN